MTMAKPREVGFGIIGYGKLGGLELSYGVRSRYRVSARLARHAAADDGDKPLDNRLFFARLVRRLAHFLTTQTGSGELYEIDTRLRPDGRSGVLVTSTDAFETLPGRKCLDLGAPGVAACASSGWQRHIGTEFERIRSETLSSRVHRDSLRDDVISMRQRMRKELDRSDGRVFDLKHGQGGIGDIEFLVQYLVLQHARRIRGCHRVLRQYSPAGCACSLQAHP